MWTEWDDDEYKTVVTSRPCSACDGGRQPCRSGRCNGSFGIGFERRPASEVAQIKAARRRIHEEEVLAEAARIRVARGSD